MIFKPTKLKGVFVIDPELQEDERGYFGRVFCQEELSKAGIDFIIRQVSQALSVKKGTVTLRDRDSTKQVKVKISELSEIMRKVVSGQDVLKLGKLVETRVK